MSRDAESLGRTRDAAFLGYHAIAEDGPPYLSLRPETFAGHLDLLAAKGYRSGTREDLDALLAGGKLGGRRALSHLRRRLSRHLRRRSPDARGAGLHRFRLRPARAP